MFISSKEAKEEEGVGGRGNAEGKFSAIRRLERRNAILGAVPASRSRARAQSISPKYWKAPRHWKSSYNGHGCGASAACLCVRRWHDRPALPCPTELKTIRIGRFRDNLLQSYPEKRFDVFIKEDFLPKRERKTSKAPAPFDFRSIKGTSEPLLGVSGDGHFPNVRFHYIDLRHLAPNLYRYLDFSDSVGDFLRDASFMKKNVRRVATAGSRWEVSKSFFHSLAEAFAMIFSPARMRFRKIFTPCWIWSSGTSPETVWSHLESRLGGMYKERLPRKGYDGCASDYGRWPNGKRRATSPSPRNSVARNKHSGNKENTCRLVEHRRETEVDSQREWEQRYMRKVKSLMMCPK